jgi:hypothetical protein
VHTFGPTFTQLFFQSTTGKVEPHLVKEHWLLTGIQDKDHHWRRIRGDSEALLVFPVRPLGTLTILDFGLQLQHRELKPEDAGQVRCARASRLASYA